MSEIGSDIHTINHIVKPYLYNKKIKNTKKKSSRQKQRTAKKIKHSRRKLLGGKAKIDMAYTYLAFDLNLIKQYTLLNDWVYKNSLLCSCKAISTDVTNCKLSNQSGWVIDEQQEIILVSKFDTIQNIYFNKFDLNNPIHFEKIINNVLGFCIIRKDAKHTNNVISIYDVCITKSQTQGYGKVLFAVIMTYLEITYSKLDPILWLGIKIDNIDFNKICNLYTSFGFAEPFITHIDPFNNNIGFPVLSLSKKLSHYVNIEASTYIVFNKAVYMKDNYLTKQVANFNIMFDKTCLFKMRLFPYLTTGGITPILESSSPSKNHREYSGTLIIINNSYQDKSLLCNLSFETIGNNSFIKYIEGGTESVITKYESYTYHTHPIALYTQYNCSIGTPSGADVGVFFGGLLPYINVNDGVNSYESSSITQSHFVIAVEGIYCLSFHRDFISKRLYQVVTTIGININDFNMLIYNLGSLFEFPFEDRAYDWGEILVDYAGKDYPEDLVQNHIQKYLSFFNQVNNNFEIDGIKIGPIFDMQFKSWKDLFDRSEQKSKMFNIHIPTIYQNSFVPSSDFKIIPHIYGPDFIENLVATKAYEYEYTDSKTEDLVIEDVEMEDSQPM